MLANASWTFIGNGLYSASQWLMIVVLARCTNPDTVGTLALALAITAPVMQFFNMQQRVVVSTDVKARYRLADYVQTRLLTTAAAVGLIIICILPFHLSPLTAAVIILVTLSKAAESVSDILYGHWQLIEQMDVVGKSLVIRGSLTLVAFALSVTLTRSLIWGAASLLLGSMGVLLVYDVRQLRHAPSISHKIPLYSPVHSGLRYGPVASLIRLTAPLGFVAMLISLNSSIPRYFIEIYDGKGELGIFSALSYFIVAGNLIVNAVGQSAVPRLAKLYYLPERRQFRRMLAALFAVSGALSAISILAAVLFGRRLLSIYGQEYADFYDVFVIVMGVASTGYFIIILNYALNAIGAYNAQVPLFLAITGVLTVFCKISVPVYGLRGAAVSLLSAGAIQVVASAVLLGFKTRSSSDNLPCEQS